MDKIKECRSCKSERLKEFFDLGEQPLANSLLDNINQPEKLYPLSLSWCEDCNLVQLNHTISPEELFSDYVWVTGTSSTAKNYSYVFYNYILSRIGSLKDKYVLEIASNDGTFLLPFIEHDCSVLGVDPAKNIAEMASKNGIPTRCAFFGENVAREVIAENGYPKVIFARNVLPHVANTHDFVESLKLCLDDEGTLVLEVHYAKKILEELHYDSIYHEHLCYFTFKSIEKLLSLHGLYAYDLETSPISGGSLVLFIKKKPIQEKPIIQQYRDNEEKIRLNELSSWVEFAQKSFEHRKTIIKILSDSIIKQKRIVGYGASARSSTMLNFCKIEPNLLSEIADQNPLKIGKYTAGTHIPIKHPDQVMANKPDSVLILAWNFAEEIISILKNKYHFQGECIIPLPHVPKVVDMGATSTSTKPTFGQIEGVVVQSLKKIPDVRGTIMHGVRSDNILNNFGEVYFKKFYSGIINGWHAHETLQLNWICLSGMIKCVLYDLRNNSSTKNVIQEVFMGDDNYVLLHVPPGIATAITVITGNSALVCNVASEPHNPSLKYRRIDPHSKEIDYDWNKKDF